MTNIIIPRLLNIFTGTGLEPPPAPTDINHGSELTLGDVGPTGELTPSGTITTSLHGQVIEDVEVNGIIIVRHSNVVIRNVRVRSTSNYAVSIPLGDAGFASFSLEHSDLIGISGPRSAGVVHYGKWSLYRTRVRGFEDGIKIGSDSQIIECWIDDDYYNSGDSHNDGIQSVGGVGSQIIRSHIEGPFQAQTAALILQTNNSLIDGYIIEDNYISGGGYSMYIRDKGNGFGVPSNMVVKGNRWEDNSWEFGPASNTVGTGWVWEDNETVLGVTVNA